jgi:RNA polymerase sigma-70 factor (ECF subfamily)
LALQLAVDCVQEGLCTFLHRREQLPDDADAWAASLATIVRNAARNRRRRHFVSRPHEAVEAQGGRARAHR